MASAASRDIFAPSHYEAARRPLETAEPLPPWCYTSPEFRAWEIERLFRRNWLCVARVDEIAAPGDYLACAVAGVRVILVRGRDGVARAFANTCRHRGAMLLDGNGNCRAIQCPYHSWTLCPRRHPHGRPGHGGDAGLQARGPRPRPRPARRLGGVPLRQFRPRRGQPGRPSRRLRALPRGLSPRRHGWRAGAPASRSRAIGSPSSRSSTSTTTCGWSTRAPSA